MEDCVFCKIIKGEIPSEKVYEDEEILAFKREQEQTLRERKIELAAQENKVNQREQNIDRRDAALIEREKQIEIKLDSVSQKLKDIEKKEELAQQKLESIEGELEKIYNDKGGKVSAEVADLLKDGE